MQCEQHKDMQKQMDEINMKIEALRERVNDIEKINISQNKDFEKVFSEIEKMEEMQKEILTAIKGLEEQKARKYDKIKEQISYVVLGGVLSAVGFLVSFFIRSIT